MTQSQNLPSVSELQEMQEDLIFKQEEMKKAANTVDSLETRQYTIYPFICVIIHQPFPYLVRLCSMLNLCSNSV